MDYDVATIIWTIGLILAGSGLVVIAIAIRRLKRHGANLSALPPELAAVGAVRPEAFVEQRALLGRDLQREGRELPNHEREIVHHAMWHAMLLETVCDGDIDRREIGFVLDLFGQLSGRQLASETAVEAAEAIAADPRGALVEIAKARTMSQASREHVLEGAFLVSTADGELIASEANRLGDIADALGLALEERQLVYEKMAGRLEAHTNSSSPV